MSTTVVPQQLAALPATQVEDWRTAYPPEAWRQIVAEGVYLASILVLPIVVSTILLNVDFAKHEIVKQILYCALGGLAGSWIYSVKWYVRAVTKKKWRHDVIAWQVSSPFMGTFLAISVFFAIRAGFFGVRFDANDTDPRVYAYAIGFMTGLFSDEVMNKLTEVAGTLFGRTDSAR